MEVNKDVTNSTALGYNEWGVNECGIYCGAIDPGQRSHSSWFEVYNLCNVC